MPGRKLNKQVIVILLLCMTLLGVSGTDIYISSLPQMARDFDAAPPVINATILFFNLGMAISVLFTGILSNRFGRKIVIISGILQFSIASLLIVWAPTIWLILGLRAAQGAGCGGIIIVQRLILRDIMTESEQVHAGGILVLGSIISPALAPVIGAFIAKFWSWHACFLFSAVFGFILAGVSWVIIQETNSTPIKRLPRLGAYLRDYILLIRDPMCFNLVSIMCLTFAAYFAFLGISSYLYIITLGLSPVTYSYIFILLAASYFAGNSYMMYLNKHGYSSSRIIKRGVNGGILGAAILGISLIGHNHWLILICLTLGVMVIRIASALIINPTQIKIVNHFKERGALALGIAISLQFGIAGAAATVVGLFTQPQLLYGFVCLTAACLVLAAASFFILAQKSEND